MFYAATPFGHLSIISPVAPSIPRMASALSRGVIKNTRKGLCVASTWSRNTSILLAALFILLVSIDPVPNENQNQRDSL